MSFVGPVQCRVDVSGFNRGFELAMQFSTKKPTDAVNYTAKEVAFGAYQRTPFVTPQRIDTELAVVETPVIGKRGKPLKRKKKIVPNPNVSGVPLAALIVQARANPNSRYNALTAGRYALAQSPFKGVSREAGRAAMAAMIDIMVKGRHSSGRFVATGWSEVAQKLKALIPSRFGGSILPSFQGHGLGDATPAVYGTAVPTCIIENDVGLEGQNAASNNRALMETAPALQASLDDVGRKEFQRALDKIGREDLELPVNKAWG